MSDGYYFPPSEPGPHHAYRLGLPYLLIDQHGQTQVTRNPEDLAAARAA